MDEHVTRLQDALDYEKARVSHMGFYADQPGSIDITEVNSNVTSNKPKIKGSCDKSPIKSV